MSFVPTKPDGPNESHWLIITRVNSLFVIRIIMTIKENSLLIEGQKKLITYHLLLFYN